MFNPQTFCSILRYRTHWNRHRYTKDCNSEIFNDDNLGLCCTHKVTRCFGSSRWDIAAGAAVKHTSSASVTSDTGVHPNVDELRGDARRCNSGRTNLYPTYSGSNARLVMLEFHCRGLARLPVSQLAKLSTKNDLLLLSIISVDKIDNPIRMDG